MHNRLIIIGAGGHGKVVADIAFKSGYTDISFADDKSFGLCMGFPIICKINDAEKFNDGNTDFVIAIGNNEIRKEISEKYSLNWVSLIHPSAQIGMNAKLGLGTVVMAGAVINPCAVVGNHCIINTCAVIEHDNVIKDYVHISPNSALGGTVTVGELTHIGIGATVKNNVEICENCIIGAGGVVVTDVVHRGTYVGVPVKRIK